MRYYETLVALLKAGELPAKEIKELLGNEIHFHQLRNLGCFTTTKSGHFSLHPEIIQSVFQGIDTSRGVVFLNRVTGDYIGPGAAYLSEYEMASYAVKSAHVHGEIQQGLIPKEIILKDGAPGVEINYHPGVFNRATKVLQVMQPTVHSLRDFSQLAAMNEQFELARLFHNIADRGVITFEEVAKMIKTMGQRNSSLIPSSVEFGYQLSSLLAARSGKGNPQNISATLKINLPARALASALKISQQRNFDHEAIVEELVGEFKQLSQKGQKLGLPLEEAERIVRVRFIPAPVNWGAALLVFGGTLSAINLAFADSDKEKEIAANNCYDWLSAVLGAELAIGGAALGLGLVGGALTLTPVFWAGAAGTVIGSLYGSELRQVVETSAVFGTHVIRGFAPEIPSFEEVSSSRIFANVETHEPFRAMAQAVAKFITARVETIAHNYEVASLWVNHLFEKENDVVEEAKPCKHYTDPLDVPYMPDEPLYMDHLTSTERNLLKVEDVSKIPVDTPDPEPRIVLKKPTQSDITWSQLFTEERKSLLGKRAQENFGDRLAAIFTSGSSSDSNTLVSSAVSTPPSTSFITTPRLSAHTMVMQASRAPVTLRTPSLSTLNSSISGFTPTLRASSGTLLPPTVAAVRRITPATQFFNHMQTQSTQAAKWVSNRFNL